MANVFKRTIGYIAAAVAAYNGQWALAFALASSQYGYTRGKIQQRRAKDAHNAALQDRMEMVDVAPEEPRTIALGRVRAVEGVRRRWVSGEHDEKLTMIVSLAGHEIDAVEAVYFDDVLLELDAGGYVLTEPYNKTREEPFSARINVLGGTGSVDLAPHVVTAATLTFVKVGGDGEPSITVVATVTAGVATITGAPADGVYRASYQLTTDTSTARVRIYLGEPGQNVGADLAAEYGGNITATDAFAGMALLVVDVEYDPDVYPQGRPNVTALFRGAKVYDPRLDSTVAGGAGAHRINDATTWAWSENSALLAYHYARHANGWALPVAAIMPAADVATEADRCDVSTTFTLRKPDDTTETVTLPRHQAGITIPTDTDPGQAMQELLESMAGRAGWAGGVWRFRAGRMPAAVFEMGPEWLVRPLQEDGLPEPGPIVTMTNGVPREQKINRVTGRCVDPAQRYQVLPFPAVQDAVLISEEGATYPQEVEYQAVNEIAHAQHLASITIRRNQAALRLQAGCGMQAYQCELFDVGTLTLPRYGITDKTMEVVGWRWHPEQGVELTLAEITDAIYTVDAELAGRDPAPNTNLPSPWQVETLADLVVTSGTAALVDGSLITRTQLEWTAAAGQAVRAGGRVEVQFSLVGQDAWQVWEEAGTATQAVIPGLLTGEWYVFQARFVSAAPLRVRGDWCQQQLHQVALPPTVTDISETTSAYTSGTSVAATYGITPYYTGLYGVAGIDLAEDAVVVVTCSFDAASAGSASAQLYGKFFIALDNSATQHAARVWTMPQTTAEPASLPMVLTVSLDLAAGQHVVGAYVETRSGIRSPPWLDATFADTVTTKVEVFKR